MAVEAVAVAAPASCASLSMCLAEAMMQRAAALRA